MIDHIMLRVRDHGASKRFYEGTLATLGYKPLMEFKTYTGYGDRKPYFWIGEDKANPHPRTHVAFIAKDRAAVDAFHAKAMELGAKSDGEPGLREQYHPNYYGAFVFDPDGNNVEAVCHAPPEKTRSRRKAASSRATRKSTSRPSRGGKAAPRHKRAARPGRRTR